MKLKNWLLKLRPFIVIVGIVLLFFHPVWREGKIPLPADLVVGSYFPWLDYNWGYPTGVPVKNPITSDAISFSFPMKMLAIDLMKSGQWPLWNPYILAGTPLLANFQSSAFSPTNFVYLFTDKLTAWSIQVILQHVLAALGIYFLLRYWKISKPASVFSGIIFAFCGFNLIWSEWNSHALSAAFLPFLILFASRFILEGRFWGILLSISLALQFFSGYPQIVFYSLLALVILVLINFKFEKKFFLKICALLVFILIGFGLAAPQLLPGYELLSLSQRKSEFIPSEWVFLEWKQVITFIAPDYFGNHSTANYWGPKNYTSNIGFVSVTALLFAISAIKFFQKKKEIKFLTVLAIISLFLSLNNPLSYFLWKSNILGFGAGVSLRGLILFCFSVSALAGFGLHYLLKSKKRQSFKPPFLFVGTLILYFLISASTFGGEDLWKSRVALRNLFVPSLAFLSVFITVNFIIKHGFKMIGLICIFLSLLSELFYFGWKFTPFSPRSIVYPQTSITKFLQDQQKPFRIAGTVIPTNLLIPYKLESLAGYDAVYPLNIAKFIAVLNSNDSNSSPQDRYGIVNNTNSLLLNLTNSRYVLLKKNEELSKGYKPGFEDKSVKIVENENTMPRAFMVYDWEEIQDGKIILDKLIDADFQLDKKVLLDSEATFGKSYLSESQVNYLSYGEQESLLSVKTKDDGLLFLSDTWYPGWKAFIDGKEVKIYKADFAFRAIEVLKGDHNIRFIYTPDTFYTGIKISCMSILILVLIQLLYIKNSRIQK